MKRPRPVSLPEEVVSSSSENLLPIASMDDFMESPRKRTRISNNNNTSRRVQFASSDKFSETTSPLDKITLEEASELWYRRTDIKLNQIEARNHILHGLELETNRGYERYELDRVRNKSLALKCTLLVAQQATLSQEEIAEVIQDCTACARRQAFLTGTQDFFGAYFDDQ